MSIEVKLIILKYVLHYIFMQTKFTSDVLIFIKTSNMEVEPVPHNSL